MRVLIVLMLCVVLSGFLLQSCQNEKEELPSSQTVAEEESLVTELLSVIELVVESKMGVSQEMASVNKSMEKSASVLSDYPVIEVEFPQPGKLWPRIVTIDFGPKNIELMLGNELMGNVQTAMLKGKVVVAQMRPLLETGAQRNVSFESFSINNIRIEGETSLSNDGLNNNDNWMFGCYVDIKLVFPGGAWVKRNATRESELTQGALTPLNIWDDVFIINGISIGTNSKGWSYTVAQQNVEVKRSCRYPTKGLALVEGSNVSYSVDFGNGQCDNAATITDNNGTSYELFLGRN